MGNRRFTTLECSTLHQSLLPAQCKGGGASGPDRFRGAAFHCSRGGDNLQLRTRIFRVLLQENRLPLQIMPRKGNIRRDKRTAARDCIARPVAWKRQLAPRRSGSSFFGALPGFVRVHPGARAALRGARSTVNVAAVIDCTTESGTQRVAAKWKLDEGPAARASWSPRYRSVTCIDALAGRRLRNCSM
jgi:hypothetical protein